MAPLRAAGPGSLTTSALRSHNARLVLACVRDNGPVSRSEIADLVGLTRPAITRIVADLTARGLVVEAHGDSGPVGVGRPRQPLELDRSRLAGIGIDLRVDHLEVRGVTLAGGTMAREGTNIRPRPTPGEVVDSIESLVSRIRGDLGHETTGIGVAIPGALSPDGRVILASAHLGWHDVPFAAMVEERLGTRIRMSHVAAAAALANARHEDFRSFHRLLQFQVGMGAGVALARGRDLDATLPYTWGAVGHLPLGGDPDASCPCGRRGCLDTSVGFGAFSRAAGLDDLPVSSRPLQVDAATAVARRAEAGDARAQAAIEALRADLARALVTVALMEGPDMIVLGGYLLGLGDGFLRALDADVAQRLLAPSPLRTSPLADEAPGLGAALLGLADLTEPVP
jgi:predicted NBD/HSP70 family sugar kinase/biotin operon repressor